MLVDPETKFGIRIRTRTGAATLAQKYSLLAGVVYLAVGVIGFFVTGFGNFTEMTDHALLGIFTLNPYHNVVNLVVGGLWLLGAVALTPPATEGLNLGLGLIWALTSVLGILGYLNLMAVTSGPNPDNLLHLVTAVLTLVFGAGLPRSLGSGDQATTA